MSLSVKIVPCYPQTLCPGHFLLAPHSPSVVSIAVTDFNVGLHLLSFPVHTTGREAEELLAPSFRLLGFCGAPLHTVQHLFDGMVLTACPVVAPEPMLAQGCPFRVSLAAAIAADASSKLQGWCCAASTVAQLWTGRFFQPTRELDFLLLDWPLRKAPGACGRAVD